MSSEYPELTRVIAASAEDSAAREEALRLVYDDLLRIARAELGRHRRGDTLNTRVLVNEAYLKLFEGHAGVFENRVHFFATAARAMRQVVIDYARARLAERRGGGAEHVPLDVLEGAPLPVDEQAAQLVGMDRAMEKLALLDPRLVQVVEMRFFAGLEVKQIAELLGVSEPTIKRDTRAAKAFLQKELEAA
ncbi:ECF-type sigma factor [Dokdonella fugitiva]|jgi:RNA polymerase sigma factor (TIGR02999 family)|uniref:RNA polymerase sigma factor (TIGR02999 family) n=1 Tax=Dokdonella fugitiva TaxID=328517 RepID=A0A4R2I8I4_9GAMM|nr:ECF-type sigma factor [Dokdonella fugitiva]MBA8883347.1 RNA polymerase sigma factor (TIGR02999 family) [Dokdonella fugitiva]TCO40664.1 RNA polymerase sigma factor (TIGR02999 family) [Dokdonella fugitiva]